MTELERILDRCLEQIERGEKSLEEVLAEHPSQAATLETLIREALELRYGQTPSLDRPARARMRVRLSRHMARHPRRGRNPLRQILWPRTVRWATAALVTAFLALASATLVAQAAVPGDPLYPLKRVSESAWGELVGRGIDYRLAITERRLVEWIRLNERGVDTSSIERDYRRSLDQLETTVEETPPGAVYQELRRQRERLQAADLSADRLDELLQAAPTPVPAPTELPATVPPSAPLLDGEETEQLTSPTQVPEPEEILPPTSELDLLP